VRTSPFRERHAPFPTLFTPRLNRTGWSCATRVASTFKTDLHLLGQRRRRCRAGALAARSAAAPPRGGRRSRRRRRRSRSRSAPPKILSRAVSSRAVSSRAAAWTRPSALSVLHSASGWRGASARARGALAAEIGGFPQEQMRLTFDSKIMVTAPRSSCAKAGQFHCPARAGEQGVPRARGLARGDAGGGQGRLPPQGAARVFQPPVATGNTASCSGRPTSSCASWRRGVASACRHLSLQALVTDR
jgi:hypothetical protein